METYRRITRESSVGDGLKEEMIRETCTCIVLLRLPQIVNLYVYVPPKRPK